MKSHEGQNGDNQRSGTAWASVNFLLHNWIVAIPVLTENTPKYLGMRDMMFKTLYSLVTL